MVNVQRFWVSENKELIFSLSRDGFKVIGNGIGSRQREEERTWTAVSILRRLCPLQQTSRDAVIIVSHLKGTIDGNTVFYVNYR